MSHWIDLPDRVKSVGGNVVDIDDAAQWVSIAADAQAHPQVLHIEGIDSESTIVAIPLSVFEALLDYAHLPDDDGEEA